MFITIHFSIKSNELDSSVWTAVEINNTPDSPNCLCMCFDMNTYKNKKFGQSYLFVYAQLLENVPHKEFHEQLCID